MKTAPIPYRSAGPREFEVRRALAAAREAQASWADTPLARRLAVVREVRHAIAESAESLAVTVRLPQRGAGWQTVTAEILPLADACRYLEREAPALLAPRRPGRRGRPAWLAGSSCEVRRDPWGVVLILGPANYPLLLPGVQMMQALVAGNAVLVKPGRGAWAAARSLADLLHGAGLPEGLLGVLDESVESAIETIERGVDKVVLTGAHETGRRVAGRLAASLTPAVFELSGCDAAFVREEADLALVTRALVFGATFNGGFTCIAPRRVFVAASRSAELVGRLVEAAGHADEVALDPAVASRLTGWIRDATAAGARLRRGSLPLGRTTRPIVLTGVDPRSPLVTEDFAAPLLSITAVADDDEALRLAAACPFELGATIFGAQDAAERLAGRVRAGVVVINDLIVPTADPRLPFSGRGKSGYGATRGAEGLLEMTRPRTVIRRRGRTRPHFTPAGPREERLFGAYLRAAHGRSFLGRLAAVRDLVRHAIAPAEAAGK